MKTWSYLHLVRPCPHQDVRAHHTYYMRYFIVISINKKKYAHTHTPNERTKNPISVHESFISPILNSFGFLLSFFSPFLAWSKHSVFYFLFNSSPFRFISSAAFFLIIRNALRNFLWPFWLKLSKRYLVWNHFSETTADDPLYCDSKASTQ